MPAKSQAQVDKETTQKQQAKQPDTQDLDAQVEQADLTGDLRRASVDPRSLRPGKVLQLQRTVGNQATHRLLTGAVQRQIIQREPWDDLWDQVATYMDPSARDWFNIAKFLNLPVPKAEEFGHRSKKSKDGSKRADSRLRALREDVWTASRIPEDMPEQKALSKLKQYLRRTYDYRG